MSPGAQLPSPQTPVSIERSIRLIRGQKVLLDDDLARLYGVSVKRLNQQVRRNSARGSHHQFKHASKPGRVTVPGKPGDDLAPGTLNSILKQAGLKK